uniref:Uncharacterized protein n=1 Tax=Janibacter limosus TaxID=53458 RepID=A0AC61U6U7_9MICO|nr:hypothetical protein [Janibacter limosus]
MTTALTRTALVTLPAALVWAALVVAGRPPAVVPDPGSSAAVAALTSRSAETAAGTVPTDFVADLGYVPRLEGQRLVNPTGSCSSPRAAAGGVRGAVPTARHGLRPAAARGAQGRCPAHGGPTASRRAARRLGPRVLCCATGDLTRLVLGVGRHRRVLRPGQLGAAARLGATARGCSVQSRDGRRRPSPSSAVRGRSRSVGCDCGAPARRSVCGAGWPPSPSLGSPGPRRR